MTPSPNKVALFLDGTWNTTHDNTNVWRLKSLCSQTDSQKVYYSAGVGTAKGEKVTGGMFGIGINEEVVAAYEWLVEHCDVRDQIFIFGFSRGAFTARSLAGFVSKCGLLKPGSPLSMNQLYERYRKAEAPSIRTLQKTEQGLSLEDRWRKKYSRVVPVWFQGVWDTVGTLGVPLPCIPKVSREDYHFLETDLRINDTHAYHALAIDEHREAFKPTLWTRIGPPNSDLAGDRDFPHVEQRWFAGAHSNVGGGYDNDLLAQAPLKWIMSRAAAHGLVFKDDIELDDGAVACPIRDSLKEMVHGIYEALHLGQRYYRTIGDTPTVTEAGLRSTINESIDATVFERWRADAAYRPQNLKAWAVSRGVDPAAIETSIDAHAPSKPVTA